MGTENRVVVADFDMPFLSIVTMMLKVALASIPALFFLSVFGFIVFLMFGVAATLAQ